MPADAGARRLHDTSERIWAGYHAIADELLVQGDRNLSAHVRRFADRIRYRSTEQDYDRERIRKLLLQRGRSRDAESSR